ncbi:uncharacterized protein LOC134697845 [Mytilus trossulus]|uniref:uncharacterized protein LOC134697845 n=1 Tax=Mytilus trossulus TaxID=6551 RepID=UPI0030042EFC
MICIQQLEAADPCQTTAHIDDWQRSVAFAIDTTQICDNVLADGWYRVTSNAGELMPTQCPIGGLRCNTAKPIYLYVDDLPAGEEPYPSVGVTVNRTAYASNYDGNCKHTEYDIQIKNCDGYFVYFLTSITGGCTSAYCFGDQLPCTNGTTSANGFTPDCEIFPNVTVTPYVKVTLTEREAINEFKVLMVYSNATFECHADDLQDGYTYTTRWYVNDIEMKNAKLQDLSKTDLEAGLGRMLEEHWASIYKPNMLVKCALQVGGGNFTVYGPQHKSPVFFAGLKIAAASATNYQVKEGEELQIPASLTMPLSCAWPKYAPEHQIASIKKDDCLLVLLNGVPDYQTKGCTNGITKDGLVFTTDYCGIKFAHSNWQDPQLINITGQIDQLANIEDRLINLRLYNADTVAAKGSLSYWRNYHTTDIKIYVIDKDVSTLGQSCFSNNDPHMRTFDQQTYELQLDEMLAGEYIMYKHLRLPLQVSAYFQSCYTNVLCNCGVAVRSGDSLFVANYCETKYNGINKVNRYMKQRLCDDQSLIVTKTSSSYTITLPTGTKLTFNYGSTYIDGINITPSVIDTNMTKGLCGIYNGNTEDDYTPRDQLDSTDLKTFVLSWHVNSTYPDETLFHPNGTLKETEYYGQQYCTCVTPNNTYPHGDPDFDCELTSAMRPCRNTKTTLGVYTADCATVANRKKRDVSGYEHDDLEPPSYPMESDESPLMNITKVWHNGWTEDSARQHCTYHFQNAAAYNACSVYVPYVESDPFISGCVLDIKSTGGDSWLKVAIKNFASACRQESKRLEILTVNNSTNSTGVDKPISAIIEESTCPDNCSNHGLCVNEECQCIDGYYGELCSFTAFQAPTVIFDAFEGLCDSSKKPCRTFIIPGYDFINGSSLTCKYTAIILKKNDTSTLLEEENTFTHSGVYGSSQYMYCKLPGSRKKRSTGFETVATGYRISVSNNGQNYTDPVTTIVYDSTCYECDTTSMSCDLLETCPVKSEEPSEESKTKVWLIVLIIAPVIIILIVIAVIFFKWKVKPKQSYVRDASFISMPDTSRQSAARRQFLADEHIPFKFIDN